VNRYVLVLLILVGAGLGLTNPDVDDFAAFLETHAQAQLEEALRERLGGDSRLGDLLAGAGGDLVANHAPAFTDRTTYLVASTYAVDLDRRLDTPPRWRFLGIAGTFIQMKGPED
jgi:hypothetical protein